VSNKIFVGRVKTEEKTGVNGPWTKTSISFNQSDLDLLRSHMNQAGYVNLDFNRSKKGNEYIEINTYKPQKQQSYQAPPVDQVTPQKQQSYQAPTVDQVTPQMPQNTPVPAVNDFSQNINDMNNKEDIPF
tara:strand:- start:43 stop:432 length:390 start_codon:yes stop_codon:yes gene_type:complete